MTVNLVFRNIGRLAHEIRKGWARLEVQMAAAVALSQKKLCLVLLSVELSQQGLPEYSVCDDGRGIKLGGKWIRILATVCPMCSKE